MLYYVVLETRSQLHSNQTSYAKLPKRVNCDSKSISFFRLHFIHTVYVRVVGIDILKTVLYACEPFALS